MKKSVLILLVMIFTAALGFSQMTGDVPESVKVSLDGLLKTRTPNGTFEMAAMDSYFYASQGSVYTNMLFTANLDDDQKELNAKLEAAHKLKLEKYNTFVAEKEKVLAEKNKAIIEKNKRLPKAKRLPELTWDDKPAAPKLVLPNAFHNLYVRVVQAGKVIQHYKCPMPKKCATEYYSFGLILTPGKYDILMDVNRYDNTQDGTLLMEVDVPQLTVADIVTPAKNISNSAPVFFKKINTLHEADKRFNVVTDRFQVSPSKLEFFPYEKNEFKANETPTITFFILGVNQPWNVEVKLDIKQGKKKVVAFKVPPMQNPYFFQVLAFIGKDKKPLAAGDYMLVITLNDNNQKGRKGKLEIPFKIIE